MGATHDEQAFARQWRLLQQLAATREGLLVVDLARESGVNQRTIRRDLLLFEEVGVPLAVTTARHGRKRYSLAADWRQPALTFTFEEAIALHIGGQMLAPLAGTTFEHAARTAFGKIKAALGPAALAYLEKLAGSLAVRTASGGHDAKGPIVEQLLLGLEDRRVVHIAYQSARSTEPLSYPVHPYALVLHKGAIYLVAFSEQHDELRHFKVSRISAAEVDRLPFRRPADFDLAGHLAGSFGIYHAAGDVRVVVRFAPAVARYVQEGKWHASQKLARERDGSVLAEFRLSGTTEIKAWILGFGRNAEVLEPAELRGEMVEELRLAAGCYAAEVSKRNMRPDSFAKRDQ